MSNLPHILQWMDAPQQQGLQQQQQMREAAMQMYGAMLQDQQQQRAVNAQIVGNLPIDASLDDRWDAIEDLVPGIGEGRRARTADTEAIKQQQLQDIVASWYQDHATDMPKLSEKVRGLFSEHSPYPRELANNLNWNSLNQGLPSQTSPPTPPPGAPPNTTTSAAAGQAASPYLEKIARFIGAIPTETLNTVPRAGELLGGFFGANLNLGRIPSLGQFIDSGMDARFRWKNPDYRQQETQH